MWTYDSNPTGSRLLGNALAAWAIVGTLFVLLVFA